MIAGLRGTVEGRTGTGLLLSVGGIVLDVQVPSSLMSSTFEDGSSIYLHTHLQLRDDSVALFGFGTQQELAVFRLLLTVSGVGPRVALTLISALGVERLGSAIAHEQTETLSSVSGVGKRTAARLVLELKGKLASEAVVAGSGDLAGVAAQTIAALTNLGYSPQEAQDAWRAIGADDRTGLEQALRACLGYLGQQT